MSLLFNSVYADMRVTAWSRQSDGQVRPGHGGRHWDGARSHRMTTGTELARTSSLRVRAINLVARYFLGHAQVQLRSKPT